MYYPKTANEIERRLKRKFPEIKPDIETDDLSQEHLLAMLIEMKKINDPDKAARWIGWISCLAKTHQLMSSQEIRDTIKRHKKFIINKIKKAVKTKSDCLFFYSMSLAP